jgi:hypothetical protein
MFYDDTNIGIQCVLTCAVLGIGGLVTRQQLKLSKFHGSNCTFMRHIGHEDGVPKRLTSRRMVRATRVSIASSCRFMCFRLITDL